MPVHHTNLCRVVFSAWIVCAYNGRTSYDFRFSFNSFLGRRFISATLKLEMGIPTALPVLVDISHKLHDEVVVPYLFRGVLQPF